MGRGVANRVFLKSVLIGGGPLNARSNTSMSLTTTQTKLLAHLEVNLKHLPSRTFVYHTECLGYLPFGFYHWIVAGGKDISHSIPSDWALDWSSEDLDALEREGLLKRIDFWSNHEDNCETKVTYELKSA